MMVPSTRHPGTRVRVPGGGPAEQAGGRARLPLLHAACASSRTERTAIRPYTVLYELALQFHFVVLHWTWPPEQLMRGVPIGRDVAYPVPVPMQHDLISHQLGKPR